MATFKKSTKASQEIPTSALPDIIFILLFFFMVTTKMRPTELKVENKTPSATELEKLEDMGLVKHIYIGKPLNEQHGKEPRIQVNEGFIEIKDLPRVIQEFKTNLGPKKDKMIISLKIDKDAKMGIVTDTQEKLRELDTRRILYDTKKTDFVY